MCHASPEQVVLGCKRKLLEQARGHMTVSSIPLQFWLQFPPPDFCLVCLWMWAVICKVRTNAFPFQLFLATVVLQQQKRNWNIHWYQKWDVNPCGYESTGSGENLLEYRDSGRWALRWFLNILSRALTFTYVASGHSTWMSHLHNMMLKEQSFSIDSLVTFF